MTSKKKMKKGELLAAFNEGNVGKVLHLLRSMPELAKSSIAILVTEWKRKNLSKETTPLSVAILNGNYHLCKLLVEDGVSLIGSYERLLRPLSLALQHNHSNIAELLIQSGADVNMLENDNNTYPMYWAIHEKHPSRIIEQIISAGFPANGMVVRSGKMRAMQCAILENNIEAAGVLLKHSAVANNINSSGETILNIAVKQNFSEMVQFLVNNGASLHNRKASMCPLFLAIRFEHVKMVELLIDLGADIQEGWVSTEIVPPLQYALSYLNYDIVTLLLAKGANVKARHITSHETALHVIATYLGYKYIGETLKSIQVKIAKVLLEKGANVNAKDIDGKTPLDSAICSENTELCKLLLYEGAELPGTGWIRGDGILSNRFEYIACVSAFKCPELMKLCLERGGDYNFRDRHGLTPYHCALAKHNPEMVKVFWQHSCPYDQAELIPGKMKSMLWYEPDYRDKNILAAQAEFIEGIKSNKLELVLNALKKGAEPRGCSVKIPSTLHYLAASGNHNIAKVLLESGVPINKLNKKGQSPLYVAVHKKNLHTSKLFLQHGACYSYQSSTTNNSLKMLVKESEQIHNLFKKIYKLFRLAKEGSTKVMKILQQFAESEDKDMLYVLMNCTNSKGFTLTGAALSSGHLELAKELMQMRVQNM